MSPQVNLEELGPGRIPSPRSAAGGPPAALPDVDQARIARHTGAPASVASYGRGWRLWAAFAEDEGHTALPAAPEPLARFVDTQAARGYKPASIQSALAAVGAAHRYSVAPSPSRSEDVRAAVKRAVREHRDAGGSVRQSAGITAEGLAAIEAAAARPRRRGRGWESPGAAARTRVDVALALVRTMRDALARVCEAAAWQWGQVQPGPDGSATLTFRRPKTDTDTTAYLSPATARALAAIRPPNVDAETRVFGLSPSQLKRRIAAAAKAAGLEGVSSHGCRVGMAQDLARTREELPAIMQAGGWKNERMVARYTARERAGRGAIARFYAAKGEHP